MDANERKKLKQREANIRWRQNNPEQYKASYKKQNEQRYERDKSEGFARQKAYREKNKDRIKTRMRSWASANRARLNAYRMRQHYKNKYGLTPEEKVELLISQDNRCACCNSDSPNHKQGWVVDHCHSSGKVRGILCQPCNLTLGKVKESKQHLQKLIEYLERHSRNED
jgi:hypothetical protein